MMMVVPQTELEGNQEDKTRRNEKIVEKAAQIHVVVASLSITVTFTTGFTFPGGFESDTESPNKGMAILLKRTSFCAFVIQMPSPFCAPQVLYSPTLLWQQMQYHQ
ncbi:hypothetical protein MTR67_031640 [Solanum verrucosum]|uniref:PGG domain-containing protein n=1 Tax=Solanum verrucosum TaxID=315347 RepID=A0AAF0ZGG6_SOLVR|nr:hypothetical protein MTR67_031640 [Solanum verrucosum]